MAKSKPIAHVKPVDTREVTVSIGSFRVVDTRVEADFEFQPTDKNVRYLNGMRHSYIGLEEPSIGQPRPYKHEYSASGLVFSVKARDKGKGKLTFSDHDIVVKGLRHIRDTANAEVILFDTQEQLPLEDEAPPDDGQGELPEEEE